MKGCFVVKTRELLKRLDKMVGLQNLSPYHILRIRKCGLNGIVGTPAIPNGGYYFNLYFKLNKYNKVVTVFTKTEFGEEQYSLRETFVVEDYY